MSGEVHRQQDDGHIEHGDGDIERRDRVDDEDREATMAASNGNTSDGRTGAEESCSMRREPRVRSLCAASAQCS